MGEFYVSSIQWIKLISGEDSFMINFADNITIDDNSIIIESNVMSDELIDFIKKIKYDDCISCLSNVIKYNCNPQKDENVIEHDEVLHIVKYNNFSIKSESTMKTKYKLILKRKVQY